MSNTLILSALVAASPAITSTPGPELVINEQRNVAYEELSSGRAAEAALALEASLRHDPRDPATLINLGTAYAQLGDGARAAQAFRTALTSGTRYELELADGTWDDSRAVARRALGTLNQGPALAVLGG
jgi:cytochrome c-type biogenesis protein CcmH/NrfG